MTIQDIDAAFLRPLLPARPKDAHKGDFGKVLIVAGSKGMTGAAILAARAGLKAGAGLVTVACPDSEQPVIACAVPEAMTLPLPSREGAAALPAAATVLDFQRNKKFDVCLIGPGLSLSGEAPQFARKLIEELEMPSVIDADALNALSLRGGPSALRPGLVRIFTPHEVEAGRFFKEKTGGRPETVERIQALLGGVCLLKGSATLLTDGSRLLRNNTGGPALAKGGSGDVLAGMIAGFWAQAGRREAFTVNSALESAALAVHLHGLCGQLAAARYTERGVLAGELLEFLPEAMRKIAP